MHYLIVLLGYIISGALGKYYFVTVPNVLRYEYDEVVTVSVFGLNNANVQVWLELGDKKLPTKAVVVPNEVTPVTTHVRLTEKDIIDYLTKMEERPSLIKICSKYGAHSDCQEVLISYDTGYIIMQTDKPIYTPKQKVKIRALVFDESLKAVKEREVRMDLISPSNRTLGRKLISKSSSGFYMNNFELPPRPEIGLWTARAFLKGQYDTNSRALFRVEEYVLPTFGVEIEVDTPFILRATAAVTITVKAKYVYGKSVNGKARLELKLRGAVGSDALLTTERKMLVKTLNQNSAVSFNIRVDDLMKSNAIGNQFPDGKTLEVIATVYEDETGNEEDAVHGGTMFTTIPYKFKFTQSKLNFRPGMEYFLKLEVLYANGAPAANKDIEVLMFENNKPIPTTTKSRGTDSEGNILESFPTTHQSKEIKFRVKTKDKKWTSDDFIVTPYVGKNQIQVEMVTVDGRKMMRAYTNAQKGSYTGMLFMVVSRGNVVYTKFQPNGNKVSDEMTDILEKSVSPSGRLIVFYVDKNTDEIVADSVKFNVRHVCPGKTLSMVSGRMEIKPGSTTTLKLDGDPFMHVGLNIMDKALLLLNNKHVLRRNMMFDTLESHDLGCGEGSGSNSAGVFKSTGLTVLTNAKITKGGLQRNSMDCEARQRKKRQVLDDVCKGAEPICCEKGYEHAQKAIGLADNAKDLDPLTVCKGRAEHMIVKGTVRILCVNAAYFSCLRVFADMHHPVLSARSLNFETDYISDLERVIEGGGKLRTRTDFRESWQFTVMNLDEKGENTIRLGYPDSITDWMVQGIGISDKGVCIAESVNVTAFKDFFIQLELPYKATRLEHLEAKATIFNYGLDERIANVYLDGIDGLCYDRGSGKQSERTEAVLAPNSAKTIRFPMVPMKRGNLPVTVSALVYEGASPETDVIKKYLQVENEGIEEKIPIQVCLDPLEQADDCKDHKRVIDNTIQKNGADATQVITVDLTLPHDSIPTTGFGTAYLQGNLMDNVVRTLLENGVESLFRKPAGCGEQTMLRLAPTVSAMNYLKQTKQVTDAIEATGNKYIRDGINREIDNYRHPDGGYAAWQHRPASTWLTAFVSKVFCQAKTVVDDAVESHDIASSIIWLVDNVTADGSYEDKMPVVHREMIGQIKENRDPSLTAFVLVALQECGKHVQVRRRDQTIAKAMKYLERMDRHMLRNNPYILALSTYALALTKSSKSQEFKKLLMDTKKSSKKDGSHWGNAGGFPASAHSVETTSYALLAMLQFNDIKTSGEIVRWLTSQRDAKGAFRTTQDTVVGLQALSEYSLRTYSQDLDLKISLLADGWPGVQFTITNENSVHQKIIKRLPVESGNNKLKLEVSGKGTGRMMIDFRYNRVAKKNEKCGFNVSDIAIDDVPDIDRVIAGLAKCDVCNKCAGRDDPPAYYDDVVFGDDPVDIIPRIDSNMARKKRAAGGRGKRATAMLKCVRFSVSAAYKETGMTLVRFGLETGVEVIEEDLEKLRDSTENIDAYENDGKGFVVFYLNRGSFNKTDFIFRLKDTFDDKGGQRSRQPAALTVYDYYNPDLSCTKMYRSIGESFSYRCDNSTKPQCQCLQNMCSKPSMGDKIANMNKRPALQLRMYTCNADTADYAVKVRITDTTYDPINDMKKASAEVLKSIHKGKVNHERSDEMTFYYPLSCTAPKLVKGDVAFIIGKDGSMFTDSNGHEEYMYPMMGTTLVLKPPTNKKKVRFGMIMRKYENIMTARGCAA